MSPVTHFLLGWSIAGAGSLSIKERALITIAGLAADIDGAGLLFDFLRPDQQQPLQWWSKYHHVLGHNLGFGLLLAVVAAALSTRRRLVGLLALVSFHLHLVGDLLGSRGPDGYQWPISYLLPFSDAWQWVWAGQWKLNAWPNVALTGLMTAYMFYLAWEKGLSPLELVSSKANAALVGTLRKRFGRPKTRGA